MNPNILLVITDQQQANLLSCTGNQYVHTPNMDWIAENGMRFDRAYSANPVCIPTRFCMFSGRYPSVIGQRANPVDTVDRELAALHYRNAVGWRLRNAGYQTVYAGKQHLPCATAEDAGFNVLTTQKRGNMARECVHFLEQKHTKPFALVASFVNPHDICFKAIRDAAGTDYASPHEAMLLENAKTEIEYLDAAEKLPENVSPDEFFAKYCPPLPDNHEPQRNEPEVLRELLDQRPFRRNARDNFTDQEWRMHRWAYARLTDQVDAEIGILLDAVKRLGHDRDTLIVFTSDHGDHDASHKLEHKTIPYEEAARVPLIISPPGGIEPSVDSQHLVGNAIDMLPTLCDYADATPPENLEGRSLRPLVENRASADWRDALLIESEFGQTVHTGDFQYTLFDHGANREQLYDLRNDPGQTRNFAQEPEYAEQLQAHRHKLNNFKT